MLTDVGARYLERARQILADIEEAEGSRAGRTARGRPGVWSSRRQSASGGCT